jgi:hypothetical protein
MANPPNAISITRPMDPADIEQFFVTLTQGSTGAEVLNTGESVASYTLALTAEAIAAGLQIKTGSGYATNLTGLVLSFWLAVNSANQADAAFSGTGLTLGVEWTITTNASPARVKQKTIVVQVAQQ